MINECIKSGCSKQREPGSNYCLEHELKSQTEKKRYDDDEMKRKERGPTFY